MEKRKELEEKFNELKKNQLIPAHYYCLHHDPDTGKVAIKMDLSTGEHICSICGRVIHDFPNLDGSFNLAMDAIDSYMDYIKEAIGDEDDKVDDLEDFILHLKNIRKLADKFNTYIKAHLPQNDTVSIPTPKYTIPPINGFTPFANDIPTVAIPNIGTTNNVCANYSNMTPPVNPIMENKDGLSPKHQKMMDELFKDDKPDIEGLPYDTE